MRFFEALRMAILEGKKIRRDAWPSYIFIYFNSDEFCFYECNARTSASKVFSGFSSMEFNNHYFGDYDGMKWELCVEEEEEVKIKITFNNTEITVIENSVKFSEDEAFVQSLSFSVSHSNRLIICDSISMYSHLFYSNVLMIDCGDFHRVFHFDSYDIKEKSDGSAHYTFFNKED